ncbi:HD-GYP domain-containing protein [Marinobacter zhejiangensis]|uniref:HD-GYP domain, c-di-GMP phosphodiesterase class II (Or its inactivated variant) n=1 Tax=Marinobacter zhejiangensis TaxID=488535 RepID=A0A1I4P779_9GAMM|nr:HD domain-containing phosphohydrolase [Marinobacter zhejiangensis]SFM23456.1 HD-GYP domain, c-di-GMP phosphodiesterase class II (or its inactivated variant) [Marinobacter zhejiangensis]
MGVAQKKVPSQNLEIGMFVSDLDRPWHQTPFPIQGFYIRRQEDIEAVVSHCRWVMVDVAEIRDLSEFQSDAPAAIFRRRRTASSQQTLELPPISLKNPVRYEEIVNFRKEVKVGVKVLRDVELSFERVMKSVKAGEAVDLKALSASVQKMTDSVVRNADALLWLSRVREHDDYTYQHAMNVAVWGLVCGRHMGLEPGLLNHLALGCLLAQVGKAELPVALVRNEHSLSAEDFKLHRTYVEKGVALLEASGLSRAVISVVQNHRERHNGTGFPAGVRGDRIPLLAKIAGLVDYYETLIEPRDGCIPMTPAQAVSHLYDVRNIEFQEDLVEKFIQSIGVYPVGTLVELSDGQCGVVVSHSSARRLLPKVMVMTDREKRPLKSAKVVNLADYNAGAGENRRLIVEGCLPHGVEGLNPSYYDVTGAEAKWRLTRLISR